VNRLCLSITIVMLLSTPLSAEEPKGALAADFDPAGRFEFGGPVGRRIEANVDGWLIRAPVANPGMLEMFRLRDRKPRPQLVPWAGEFVGKYLISAVQATRMSDDEQLNQTVRAVIEQLIASQAEDGYLGPFPKDTRLLANWDLWGHYHAMLALMMWHERTGDPAALETCTKAADLICATYLDTERRALDAGSDEMNLAVIHGLARLHRISGEQRYLAMAREIEKDWESAGDYFRTGLAGVEFFQTPRPRWESLHDLQGLVELYQITGDARYRTAFLNLWQSIRRWDRHNTGGFSSGERATGTPYEPKAIETCCTIAWMAITVDALRLAGDPLAADELDLSTYNGMLGSQHPSGNWWTYNTPMDGIREASDDTIVFQARAGTPELNCCSVNAPRGLGMLSEWALMRSDDGLVVNYYGPMEANLTLNDGLVITVSQETDYPLDGSVRIRITPQRAAEFTVKLRIPAWSHQAEVLLPGAETVRAKPGSYLAVRRRWTPGDEIRLKLDISLRHESGDGQMFGRMSVYRGPLLLAYDVIHNTVDEEEMPVLHPAMLKDARVSFPKQEAGGNLIGQYSPWLFVDVPTGDGESLRLCDFATAGAGGSRYVSWLPAEGLVPPPPVPAEPVDGARVPAGRMLFTWRPPLAADSGRTHSLIVAQTADFKEPILKIDGNRGSRLVVPAETAKSLKPGTDCYWKVIARNEHGTTESLSPAKRFRIDPNLPPLADADLTEYGERDDGAMVVADLGGTGEPSYGELVEARGGKPAPGPNGDPAGAVELDGKKEMLIYRVRRFPSRQYTVSIWFAQQPGGAGLGQVFSAWAGGMDDPLRICVQGGQLFARIEAGRSYGTKGVPIESGRWYHVCVVKDENQLTLWLDGKQVGQAEVPAEFHSAARDFALGGNPHYKGSSEHLACRVAGLKVYARALSPERIAEISKD
jgi:uncharacterized protein